MDVNEIIDAQRQGCTAATDGLDKKQRDAKLVCLKAVDVLALIEEIDRLRTPKSAAAN